MPSPTPPVVFDCDGVLLDTESGWTRAETELFGRYGRRYGREEKLALIGTGLGSTGKQFETMLDQPGRAAALLEELVELAAAEFARGVEPMTGAVELVAELSYLARPLAVASNSFRELVELALSGSGMREAFKVVVAADEMDHPKPAPDLFLEACHRLHVDPAEAVAIEDSPTGVVSARAAGLYVIGIPYLPEIQLPDAHLVATSLEAPEVREALGLAATSGS